MLKRYFCFIISLVTVASSVSVVLPGSKASAVAGSQFNAGRIIDDVVFFSSNTMGVGEIQNFLNSKVPVCDTWHGSSDPANQPPFTCLKDYRQDTPSRGAESGLCGAYTGGNKSSAQIIYDVANSCGVNPQVLIVLLQKEQTLVTDTWPWNIQYRSATGYGCPDTAECDAEYYGFFNQLYNAARQFRKYAKEPTQFNYRMGRTNNIQFNPSASCGSSPVYIQNQATAGLYNYTPYQPNAAALNNLYGSGDSCSAYGNRNFWRMFNDWFGASVIGAAPSPLYKSTSSQMIYVIAGGQKFPAPSLEVLGAYGLLKFPAAEVAQSFLDQYQTGDTLTTVGKKAYDPSGALYLFDDGKRYPIDIKACAKYPDGSTNTTTSWGLDCFNGATTKTLANELIDLYTAQDIVIPDMIAHEDSVWKLENGKKRRIVDSLVVDVLGGWGHVRWMKLINAQQPPGKIIMRNGYLVRFSGSAQVYFFDNEQLNPVPSPEMMFYWGLDRLPLHDLPGSYQTNDPLPIASSPLTHIAKDSSNNMFLLDKGYKLPLAGETSNWPTQAATATLHGMDHLQSIPLSNVYRSDSGNIFTVYNKKKYSFPTFNDFYELGFNAGSIRQVSVSVEGLSGLDYGGMHLSNGRLYKINDNPHQIYRVNGTTSQYVNSTNYPSLPYDKIIVVDPITAARYPVSGTYSP
jgi:hypothetical protein